MKRRFAMHTVSQDELDKLCGICPAYFVEGDTVAPIAAKRGPIDRAFDLAELAVKLGAFSFAGYLLTTIIKARLDEPPPLPPPPFTTEVLTEESFS